MIASNIIPLEKTEAKPNARAVKTRFRVLEYVNPRTGGTSWRVTGWKRDGTRVRANYAEQAAAEAERNNLETEWLSGELVKAIRLTRLTDQQVALAEDAFAKLGEPAEMPLAINHWLEHGRHQKVTESPRLDEAITKFKAWLDTSHFRERTKGNLKTRITVFGNSVPNLRICDITQETIDAFLEKRKGVSASTRDNDRRAVSRFFSYCIDRERRWTKINPCHGVKVQQDAESAPEVLPIEKCRKLLARAAKFKRGKLAPYVAVCLFGGLRPFEARRLTWDQVNLADGEIRMEASQTKNKRPRVVTICPALGAWLRAYKSKAFFPRNWRKDFDVIKAAAGYTGETAWPEDVLRHTAISHYFRNTGSYGKTAEQFGNSEAIIKRHYQGRVSSQETKAFYRLLPKKGRK